MFWFIYNFLFAIGYLLILPRFLLRMWKRGGYRRDFLQRLGVYAPEVAAKFAGKKRIWVHAVSVGEIYVALKFMDELRLIRPGVCFVLSTTTSTGHRIAENKINPDDVLIYFPSDFPFVVRRVLDRIKPVALVLTESEIWPNIIRHSRQRGIPVVMINGRISESSYRGYKVLNVFFKKVIRDFSLFLVQGQADKAKLVDIGADEAKIKVLGTAKYDVAQFDPAGEGKAREVLRQSCISESDVIITGGSTWPGEEEILMSVFSRLKVLFPNLKLVLVPRHAERSAEIEAEIRRRGLSYIRRTDVGRKFLNPAAAPDVLLVNTTGELKNFYACSTLIFVGKSLSQHGGQNIIEPALYAKPVVVGPNMENFLSVVDDFLAAKALVQVSDSEGLERAFDSLLRNQSEREAYGRRAGSLVNDKRGVAAGSAQLVSQVLPLS